MVAIVGSRRGIDHVDATLNFLPASDREPYIYTYDPPEGIPAKSSKGDPHTTRVHNAWPEADQLTLDEHGFAVGSHPSAVTDFYDEHRILEEYYPESEALVLKVTGASRAFIFDHNVRCEGSHRAFHDKVAKPARTVHNDYTAQSAPQRAAELLGSDAPAPGARFTYINLWRPIREPLRDSPLAVCDGRTLAKEDIALTSLIYPDRQGQIHQFRFNANQRWCYFPDMGHDEVLFLKCFDVIDDGRTRFTAHTAFDDPTCPPGSPPRESIEVRALVRWD